MSAPRTFFALLVSGFFLSCAVGPDYSTPKSSLPTQFKDRGSAQLNAHTADLSAWWTLFQDETLNRLVEESLKGNKSMAASALRIEEARNIAKASLGILLPQVDAQSSYTRSKSSANGAFGIGSSSVPTPSSFTLGIYELGLETQWEIDLFGSRRREWQAAKADMDAALEAARDLQTLTAAEVVQSYIDLRTHQERLHIANENLQNQEEALKIAQARLKAGIVSELDVAQAATLVETTRAQVPLVSTLLEKSALRIAVLTGNTPDKMEALLSSTGQVPTVPTKIQIGLPSELLRRRPDIRKAERNLAAATARIGVAKGDFFPRISLLGGFGFQSLSFSELLKSDSIFYRIGPAIRWPIFAGGRIKANVNVANLRQKQALLAYEESILKALEETEGAMVALLNEQVRRQHMELAVKASQRALELAQQRYISGLADFLNVLDAQRSLYTLQDEYTQVNRNVSMYAVSLYKALGGGWKMEDNDDPKRGSIAVKN